MNWEQDNQQSKTARYQWMGRLFSKLAKGKKEKN